MESDKNLLASLKRARAQHRRLFTKSCNEFDKEENELDASAKIAKLKLIEEKALIMIDCEDNVKQKLFSEDIDEKTLESEIDESEVYIDRWRSLQLKLKSLELSTSDNLDTVENANILRQNSLLHYPKIQLPSFNGDVRNWLRFWSQFQKIDKDPNLDLHDKFAYLSQSMEKGSVAEELLKSFPPTGESYERALKHLQNRFGKEEMLIQVYVRELLALVLQKRNMTGKPLRKLYDQLETKLRALEVLGVTREKYADMLFPLVESALPDETLKAWERFRAANRRTRDIDENTLNVSEKNDLDSLLEFLQDEVDGEERIYLASQSFEQDKSNHIKRDIRNNFENRISNKLKFANNFNRVSTAAELFTTAQGQNLCIFCAKPHSSSDCFKARKMSLQERENLVQKSRCCFLCLKSNHQVRKCNLKVGCLGCGKKHHVLLCRNLNQHTSTPNNEETGKQENFAEKDQTLANVSKSPNVMLQTLTVILRGNGIRHKARAIIDSGSQRSYMLRSTAREMGYQVESYEYLQHSLFGGNNTGVCKHDVFTLYLSKIDGSYNCNFKVLSQEMICETIPPAVPELCSKELSECNICITDINQGPIEILIGADVAGKLMTGGIKMLSCGLTAIETRLGWTVMGRMPISSKNDNACLVVTSMLSVNDSITKLWSLDSLGITDPYAQKTKLELEEAAREHFLETVSIKDDRYVVHLPWIESHPPLPDNYDLALKRLNTTVHRLKSQSLYEEYQNVFLDWLKEGIIEEVKDQQTLATHYLPHRPVVKEDSTTRIRPVFDASAKLKGSPSLNECLEKGENLIELIPNILIRFRSEKIGVIADIRKAFLQISVSPTDRDFLRFLWLDNNGELKQYNHCRVVFGISSSPFLLGSVIQHHLQDVIENINSGNSSYKLEVIQQLSRSFYVDNCVASVKSEEDLDIFVKMSTEVMAERKFELRGWEHSDSNSVEPTDTKVLGLIWNKRSDTLRINMTSIRELCLNTITKKKILSAAHRVFDPIGVTAPVVLIPKLLLQKIWKMKVTWEDEVDSDIRDEFLKWVENIVCLENILLPRYFAAEDVKNCTIHFFCDASKLAYAVAVFIRIETTNSIRVSLLQARSRVAPTGKGEITISRLELLAATIGSRLSSTILPEIEYDDVYYWTDSSTVLAWITREEPWGIFVYNRVKEIRELTDKNSWSHVPGSLNPADLPSRGCSAQYLLKSKWWEGPRWLYLPPEEWPNNNFDVNEEEILKERRKSIISSVTKCLLSTDLPVEKKDWYYRYFSQYSKIVNLIAWIMRFTKNCRSPKCERKQGIIDSREIINAEKRVIKMIQQECFENENDEKLKNFQCFKDQDGIIRLKTKLVYRDDNENFKTPIVLSSQHKVVERLIFHYHVKNSHAGTQMLLNILREEFWILNGRKTIRSIVSKCVICKRYSTKRLDAVAAPLPLNRVREAAVFEICGIDLAGPLILRGNQKSWICLFTCAIYRAVHLELLTSLSTEAFLLALRRFIARRGRCEVIYCDNGTNFVGASNSFQALDWNRIVIDSALRPIEWKFNPPTASWWGGWWERLIGIMKKLLRKVLGHASLTYEEMSTVLCDCESIINSRPITYVSENDAELTPLSPSMFLQDIKLSGAPDCDAVDNKSLNKRIKYRRELQNNLRKRFRSEYLGALLQRPDRKKFFKVNVGDIVLIGSDNSKRMNWPLGKIIEIIPGKEGVTRLVKLQTENGQLLRPIQRLYPLEVSAVDPFFNSKTYADRTVGQQSINSEHDDCNTDKNPEVLKKSKFGRVIKIPQRLDL